MAQGAPNSIRLKKRFAAAQYFCGCTTGEAISKLLDRNIAEARFAVRVSQGLRARPSAYH
jgi:hypothetical protein